VKNEYKSRIVNNTCSSYKEEKEEEEEEEDLSSLDFDDFDFSDVTPSMKEEEADEERNSPSFPSSLKFSELQSSTKHKTNERMTDRNDHNINNNNHTINNKAETTTSAVYNFPEKLEKGVTDTNLHQLKVHSSSPY
jgi:hypothetical protein